MTHNSCFSGADGIEIQLGASFIVVIQKRGVGTWDHAKLQRIKLHSYINIILLLSTYAVATPREGSPPT